MKYLVAYLAAFVVMFALDLSWLGFFARKFYADALGDLLLEKPRLGAAAVFYVLYVAGVVFFAVAPALAAHAWTKALLFGALLGFFAYMTYDFTNLAMIKGWPASIVAIDIAWGVFLTGAAATAGYFAAARWN